MTEPGDLLYHLRDQAEAADLRIRPYASETALEPVPRWSESLGCRLHLKLENQQSSGSFKIRGAANRLLTMPVSQRALGVVSASTGNHGKAVALAAGLLNTPALVFAPEEASPTKLDAIRALGAEVRLHGRDGVESEREARRFADANGRVYISPYNDPQVVTGQATIGVELSRQLERIDAIFAAVGGGGLVSGVAGYLKSFRREVTVVGCSAANSAVMHESVRAGRVLDMPSTPTLSDGTAGGLEADSITFPLCRALVDRWELVSEDQIAEAIPLTLEQTGHLVEGSAAVAVAAARRLARDFPGGNVVVIVCGGNIDVRTLRDILCGAGA